MTIETDLFTFLEDFARRDSTQNADLVGVTFALTLAGPGSKPPFVEVTMTDHKRVKTTETTSPSWITEFDIECWHTNTIRASDLAKTLTDLLQDYTGKLNDGCDVMATRIFNEFSGSDSAAELYNRTFTVSFSYR